MSTESNFTQYLGCEPKIAFSVGVDEKLVSRFSRSGFKTIRFDVSQGTEATMIDYEDRSTNPKRKAVPFPRILALVVVSEGEKKMALETWTSVYGDESIPVYVQNDSQLMERLLSKLNGELKEFQDRCADLNNSLVEVRQEAEDVRVAFSRIQELLWNIRTSAPSIDYASAINSDSTISTLEIRGGGIFEITQRLPCGARGLAGVDIYINKEEAASVIDIEIRRAHDDEIICTQKVPLIVSVSGWLSVQLPINIDENSVYIRVCGELKAGETLFLGQASANEISMPKSVLNGVLQKSALALRVWKGMPSLRNVNYRQSMAFRRLEAGIPNRTLRNTHKVYAHESSFEYLDVRESGEVLLHPLPSKVSGAAIPLCLSADVVSAHAKFLVNDNCASEVEFALGAKRSNEALTSDPDICDGLVFSGWFPATENFTTFALSLSLQKGHEYSDLCLFTRVPNGGSVDYGQALFREISISIDLTPSSASEKPSDGRVRSEHRPDALSRAEHDKVASISTTKASQSYSSIDENIGIEENECLISEIICPPGFERYCQCVENSPLKVVMHAPPGGAAILKLSAGSLNARALNFKVAFTDSRRNKSVFFEVSATVKHIDDLQKSKTFTEKYEMPLGELNGTVGFYVDDGWVIVGDVTVALSTEGNAGMEYGTAILDGFAFG